MRRFDAVLFDVDGTLYDNWRMYLRSIPFAISNLRLMRAFSKVRKEIRGTRPIRDFYALQAELLARELDMPVPEARELIDRAIYQDWESKLEGITIKPEVCALIDYLQGEGDLKTGVLSDFPLTRKLMRIGLDYPWDLVLSSEEVGYLKPNPEPFREAASRLGVRPEAVLYVGNSYHYDVVGSKSVGMLCAHYAPKPRQNSEADLTFSAFGQLHRWIVQQQEYT